MQKISFFIAFIALLISGYVFFQSKGLNNKIAYVDVNKVIHGYSRTNSIKNEFEKQKTELNANKDSLFQAFKSTMINFEKNKQDLTNQELIEKENEIESRRIQLNKYTQAIQQKLQQRDVENMNLLLEDINQYLKVYGDQEGYDLILGANGSGNIMYGENAIDITEVVIKGLNE